MDDLRNGKTIANSDMEKRNIIDSTMDNAGKYSSENTMDFNTMIQF